METRNLRKKIASSVIVLAFLALIGITVSQHRQIRRLTSALEQSPHAYQSAADSNSDGKDANLPLQTSNHESPADGDNANTLAYQLQAAEEELDMAHEDLGKELDRKAELAKQRREVQKQQIQSPTFKKFMRENIETQLARFIEAFNISPEDAKAFADILFDQQMASQELYLEADAITQPTDADKTRFSQWMEDIDAEYEGKAKKLLGETVYGEYSTYMSRWYIEEYEVGGFSAGLDPELELTDSQHEALVDALLEAQEAAIQENISETDEKENTYMFPSEHYSQERMDKSVEYMTGRNETILEKAGGILSDAQMEKLRTYLAQNLDQVVANMKMTALEYGYSYNIDDATDTSANP